MTTIDTINTNFVSTESSFDAIRRKNFFLYGFISSFVWMCFHFTLVFFFGLRLESVLLVGLFLGFGNFVSFLADSPVGVIQKYFNAKKIFIAGAVLMLIVSLIFLYFIFSSSDSGGSSAALLSTEMLKQFFSSGFNILLLLISVIFYGIIKELSDVTSLSYIMNNADPSEYSELLSKNNIFSGVGSMVGLIISGVVLSFNIFLAVTILVIFIITFLVFIVVYFDNSKLTINVNFADISKLKVVSAKDTLESVKQYTVTQIKKTDFANVAAGMKFIFLKPLQIHKTVDVKEIIETTKKDIRSFVDILIHPPLSHKLLIMSSVVVFFGFWDTFVVTFLVDFLDKIINSNRDNLLLQTKLFTGYVFIAILAVPAFGAQIPFINLSKKIGTFFVIFFGVILSGISMFLFGLFEGFVPILILGILNSVGYAAAMPLAQGEFSDVYNQVYATKQKLVEIDSNASAAPLKMILNLANVFGLIMGGFFVGVFGFNGTFFFFGAVLIGIFVLTMIRKTEWSL